MATIIAAAGGGNWTATGTWTGGIVPTAADDVQLTSSSGNVTINAASVCRSLDCTSYTNTLTHAAATTLTIGDATAGTGSNAFKLVSGMTYTLSDPATSALSFVSSSATVQAITTGGKTLGNYTINGTGSYQLTDSNTIGATATVSLTKGTFDTNGQTCSWGVFSAIVSNTRALTLGASSITITGAYPNAAWNITSTGGLTLSAGTSTITFTGLNAGFCPGSPFTYNNIVFTIGNGGGNNILSALTCANLTRTGAANRLDAFNIFGNVTVSGTLTINGNSSLNRTLFYSSTNGTARTVTAAAVSFSNIDFQDITTAGAANWNLSAITGLSGDCGGNTGITFTTSATQTWSGTTGGTWSANAWSGRIPLPQDDVQFASAFSASQTVTTDMTRLGKNISWVGSTGSPTWTVNGFSGVVYGSLTLISGMTLTTNQIFNFSGRASYNITSAGRSFGGQVQIIAPGGTYTLQDALTTASNFNVIYGSFNSNNFNLTCSTMYSGSSNIRAITMGTSTWTTTTVAALTAWTINASNLTFSGASSSIVIGGVSANTRTFAGGGAIYGSLSYTVAGSTGSLVMTGANTFASLSFSDTANARTLTLPSGVTTTITSGFFISGTVGKLMTINSSTPGTAATLSKSGSRVVADYLSLQDSTAAGGASWYAGSHSTNVSNNSGWIFTAPPVNASANFAIFS